MSTRPAAFVSAFALLLASCVDSQTHEVTGAELYAVHCVSCHGPEGAGDGPVAAALKVAPPDLRSLAARNGGHFPETDVLAVIDGRRAVAVHGPRDMPVWGAVFVEERVGEPMPVWRAMADARALVDHLRTIQLQPAPAGGGRP